MSNEIYIILARMTVFKMTYNNKCWLRCGELEHSYHADRDIKWGNISLEASVMVPHKGKHEPPTGPSNPLPGLHLREAKTYVHTKRRESVFTEVLFIIAPNWKQLHVPRPINEMNRPNVASAHTRTVQQ